jgi:lysophospholipase L1-like esterase
MPFRLLAPLLWIVVCLVALEVALELRATRLGWPTLLFGGAAGEKQADATWGPSDDFPFRSRRVAAEPTAGRARIWFASASYGEDVQLPPDEVFPNLVAARLRERGIECDALNASSAGNTVTWNARELTEFGARYRPDVVVLYQMSNDIDELSTLLCGRGWAPADERGAPPVAEADDPATAETDWLTRSVEETTVFKHLKSAVTSRLTRERRLAPTLGEAGEALFEARVRAFLARCRELDARAVLCTFPTAYTRETIANTPLEYELNMLRFNVFLALEGWLDSVERFNAVLRRVAGAENVPLIELAEPVSGRTELFRDMWHLTGPGHVEVAGRIAAELERLAPLAPKEPR